MKYTEAELGQYFCANTQLKTFNGGLTPSTPCGYSIALIPKWLWRKRNLVPNFTSRVPVNYYYSHVKEGWDCHQFQLLYTSSNIPTGLLVDCCRKPCKV